MSLKRQFVTVTVSKRTDLGDHLGEHQVSQEAEGVREMGTRVIVIFLERNWQAE